MDTIKSLIPTILGFLGSLVGGGPLGLIGFAVGSIALLVGGIFLYNKYKGMVFNQAAKKQGEDAVKDAQGLIIKNQQQGKDDSSNFQKSQEDKEKAKGGYRAD